MCISAHLILTALLPFLYTHLSTPLRCRLVLHVARTSRSDTEMTIIGYMCTANPHDLKCGKAAWKILHPDLPESNCPNCGAPLRLSNYNSRYEIVKAHEAYLGEYNTARINPKYYPELARARELPCP